MRPERSREKPEVLYTEETAYALALRRLSLREHSAVELARYLKGRKVPSEFIDPIVARLAQGGYVDDLRFARVMTRHQLQRGKGPQYILMKLREKGVRIELSDVRAWVEEESASRGQTELERAREIAERRYPGFEADRAVAAKAFQALVRRGFSTDVARRAVLGR